MSDPGVGCLVDVVVDADPQTSLGELVDALARHTRGVSPVTRRGRGDVAPGATGDRARDSMTRASLGSGARSGVGPVGGGAQVIDLAGRRSQSGTAVQVGAVPGDRSRSSAGAPGAPLSRGGLAGFVSGRLLDREVPLAGSPVREGVVVSLGDPSGCLPVEPVGVVDVRVSGGVGAGLVFRLAAGEWPLGGGSQTVVRLVGGDVPEVAAHLVVAMDGACRVSPVDGSVPLDGSVLRLGGEPVVAERVWRAGELLRVGDRDLHVEPVTPADAALQADEDGGGLACNGLAYNRPPRLLPPLRQNRFRLPREPAVPARRAFPVLMMVAPLLMSLGGVLLFHVWYFLLIGLLSPVSMLASYVSERRSGKRSHRQQVAEHRERKAAVEAEARQALDQETLARREEAPDAGTLLLVATGPRARLWERRRNDADHLLLRVGIGDLPSDVRLEDPDQEQDHKRQVVWTARQVPVTVALREAGVLGIAGRADLPRRLACWAVAQLAVLQSPRDVRFVILTDPEGRAAWEWVRWLPHTRSGDEPDQPVLFGSDPETLARRVGELNAMLAARRQAAGDARRAAAAFRDPDLVVVLDGARRLRSMPGMVALLADGPALGIHAICLDADERLLPEECTAVVVETATGLRVRRQRADVVDEVRADLVAPGWCERVARCLAPIRDVGESGDGASLPGSVRLLDLLGLPDPTADAIGAGWRLGGRTTQAAVGQGLDGPLALDLRVDGPHALIAGTTGAGKSELLQTLVASLAVANRPDAMTFVLVDYKGGSAFKDCERLPHTVGMVTDLDEHLVGRALESLSAELRRREHLLADAGAKDLEDYTDLADREPTGLPPLPRLVIVIDEFASLARELPDFVSGLVNIAQRGRSLGIHLVLATQRPSGVVSPEIRANTNLRIALRVTDTTESTDVIDAPDAARIGRGTPGRAFVRLGHATLVAFQSARVGGRRRGASTAGLPAPWVHKLAAATLGGPVPVPPAGQQVTEAGDTDLAALVEAIREAAAWRGLPAQHSPWLPPLPALVRLAELPEPEHEPESAHAGPAGGCGPGALPVVAWALEDLPAQQVQRAATIDLARLGHLFVVGGPRTGRSQALRTIAGALASRLSTADLHLYGIDCGNGALLPLSGLPQCGAVVLRTQTERAQRLLSRLTAEVARRQEVLAAGGFAGVGEQRAAVPATERLPHLLVLLDRWEGFLPSLGEVDCGALVDRVMALLREGASAGVHLVMAGDRQLLSGRLSVLTEDKLVLRLPDRTDFSLAGLSPRRLPERIGDGRGFRAESGLETQIALLDADPSGPAQAAAIERIAASARERDRALPRAARPFRVDVLPSRLTFDEAWALRPDGDMRSGGPGSGGPDSGGPGSGGPGSGGTDGGVRRPLWGLVGVGGDDLVAHGADLATRAPTFVVAGPSKSGRTGVLLSMVESFLRGGGDVVLLAPRPSGLRDLGGRAGVRAVLTGDDVTEEELRPLLEVPGPVVLVVDDAELLRDCMARDYLRTVVRTAGDRGAGIVIAGTLDQVCSGFTGWQVDLRKNRHGILLCPQQIGDGDLVGARLPRSAVGGPVQPGRGLLHDGGGELLTVQIPVPG